MSRADALVRADAESVLHAQFEKLAPLRGARIFICGGTGFLATWLLELIAVLNEAYRFDIRATAYSRNTADFPRRVPHLGTKPWLTLQRGDIRYIAEIPPDTDYIIHAAALTDRRLFASCPTAVAETNALGTLRLLQASQRLENLKNFLLMSSGLTAGAQPWDMPTIDERFSGPQGPIDANSVYSESKRFAETIAQTFISETKLPVTIARPFAFVGPYQSLELPWAVTDFIRDSFKGGPIRIMGDGTTVRSIMYASDFAFWTLAVLARGRIRDAYNIGSPVPVDLAALARLITQHFSPVPEIHMNVGQTGHGRSRLVPSVKKATDELGLTLNVQLGDAIQRTIQWNRLVNV